MDGQGGWLVINIFSELVLICDIVINFRTGYFDAEIGGVITDPKRIAEKYLHSWAVLDIPSATPFEILGSIFYVDPSLRLMQVSTHAIPTMQFGDVSERLLVIQMVRLVQLLRIFRVARALKDVQAAFHKILNSTLGLLRVNSNHTSTPHHTSIPMDLPERLRVIPVSYSALKIGKLFTGLVIIAHFNACIWYIIGLNSAEDEPDATDATAGFSFGFGRRTDEQLGWVAYYGYGVR